MSYEMAFAIGMFVGTVFGVRTTLWLLNWGQRNGRIVFGKVKP